MTVFTHSNVLIIVAALSVMAKIITNQNLFMVLFLLICSYGILKEELEGKIVFLLFFSSWIYVLKFDEDSFSVFHIVQFVYLLSCVLTMAMNKQKMKLSVIFGFMFFTIYILMNSGFNAYGAHVEVVGFLLNFLTVVIALTTVQNPYLLPRYVQSYCLGLMFSGVFAFLGSWIPQVSQYIQEMGVGYTVYNNNQLYTRFSGFDIDPNYFAFQVLFAIALLLVISGYKKNHLKEAILLIVLVFMGFHTLSKMFLLLLILVTFYTFTIYLKYRVTSAIKYMVLVGGLMIALLPVGLLDFMQVTISRFSEKGNFTDSVTTGRANLWETYAVEIIGNFRVFLVGNGIGSDLLAGQAAHNMYLSFWYFTGLIGIITLSMLLFISYRHIKKQYMTNHKVRKQGLNNVPLLVLITANLSLDSIIMGYFPLLLFLTLLSMNYAGEDRGHYHVAVQGK